MKSHYGVYGFYGVCLLLLLMITSTSTSAITPVTWGNLDGKTEFDWHIEKDNTYNLYQGLPRPYDGYLHMKIAGGIPDEFNLSRASSQFSYSIYGSDTGGGIDPNRPDASEFPLLILPVLINGTLLLNYLLQETSTLEKITNSTVLGISQQDQRLVMTCTTMGRNEFFEMTYTWSLSSGMLLQKHVLGDKGGEILWVAGAPPFIYDWGFLIFLVPLFLLAVICIYSNIRLSKRVKDPDLITPTNAFAYGLTAFLSAVFTIAFIMTLWTSFTFDGMI